jgi:hypothetical protein
MCPDPAPIERKDASLCFKTTGYARMYRFVIASAGKAESEEI